MPIIIDNKKKQESAELHRIIWGIANDLRGSVDGWDFKNYVFVMLFYRYILENLTNYINAGEIEWKYQQGILLYRLVYRYIRLSILGEKPLKPCYAVIR